MGEYINASIKLGGKLPAEHAAELCEFLNEKRLDPDWGGWAEVEPEDLRTNNFFGNPEVNYGNLDEILEFCHEHKLWYIYECGSGPEWDAQTVVYDPTTGKSYDFVGEQTNAISLQTVKELGNYEAILAYFERPKQLPPFEIVGDFPSEDDDTTAVAAVPASPELQAD